MARGWRKSTAGRRVACAVAAALVAGLAVATAASSANTATLSVGDTFTATGATGRLPGATSHAIGTVVVRGSWNGGPWSILTRTRTDSAGHYHFTIKPHRHGRLVLLIAPPDKYVKRFVLHVL